MADRLGTEASGLPLIPAEHAVRPDEIYGSLHIAINVDDALSPQKSSFSEEQFKLMELKKAEMSTVRKRGGMKLTFRVRSDHAIHFTYRKSVNTSIFVVALVRLWGCACSAVS